MILSYWTHFPFVLKQWFVKCTLINAFYGRLGTLRRSARWWGLHFNRWLLEPSSSSCRLFREFNPLHSRSDFMHHAARHSQCYSGIARRECVSKSLLTNSIFSHLFHPLAPKPWILYIYRDRELATNAVSIMHCNLVQARLMIPAIW